MLIIAFEHNDKLLHSADDNAEWCTAAVCIPQKVSAYDALFSTLATPKSAAVEKKQFFL